MAHQHFLAKTVVMVVPLLIPNSPVAKAFIRVQIPTLPDVEQELESRYLPLRADTLIPGVQ